MSPSPTVANLLGPIGIGIILSSIVYGIHCLQLYMYYTRYADGDSILLKTYVRDLATISAVSAVMAVDTLHAILLMVIYYHYTVECFGDVLALSYVYWPLLVQVLIGGVLASMVQLFFGFRVYSLYGKRAIVPMGIFVLSISKLAFTTAYTVVGLQIQNFTSAGRIKSYSAAGLGFDIACDSLIAITFIYYLHVRRTALSRTNRAIKLLITYALNTCLLTTVFSLVDLILYLIYTETMITSVFWFMLTRLYTCTMLSTLNSRESIRHAFDTQETLSFPSTLEFRGAASVSSVPGLLGNVATKSGPVTASGTLNSPHV